MSINHSGKSLAGAVFQGQTLVGAKFRKAKLRGADFSGCDLRSVDFRGADLREAKFAEARMGRSWRAGEMVAMASLLVSAALSFLATFLVGMAAAQVFDSTKSPAEMAGYGARTVSAVATGTAIALYGYQWKALVAVAVAGAFAVAVAGAFAGAVAGAFGSGQVIGGTITGGVVHSVLFAVAVAFAGAGSVAVAGAVGVAFAFAGAVAGAVAVRVAFAFAGAAVAGGVAVGVAVAAFHLSVIWCVRKKDERFALLTDAGVLLGALFGTRFDGADLTDANLAGAQLRGVHFGKANLTRVNWRGAGGLNESVHPGSILEQPAVRELLTSGEGRGRSFLRLDLHGANLAHADLSGANLKETNCAGANFAGADMTGACIESWNIDATTVLQGVACAEVFLVDRPDRNTPYSKRRPADANRDFAAGEFEEVYQKILNEMEILLAKGLSSKAMREAFDELRAQHPEAEVRKFENRENHVVVGVAYPSGTDEGSVERTLRGSWEAKLMIAAAENKLLESHYRDMKEVALAAAASAQSVQIGDQFVEDKRIGGNININNSQVATLTGDATNIVQSLQQSGTAGDGVAELASVLQQLLDKIGAASDLGAMEKHQAKQAVETVALAAQTPREEPSRQFAGKALETLTGLLGKVPDLTKLVEAVSKAWEIVQKTVAG